MPQNPPLTRTESPEPVVGIDQQRHLAGNWADDDAIAIDQYFEAADQTPETFDGLRIPQGRVTPATRLVTVTHRFSIANGITNSVQLLPADANRKSLTINVGLIDPSIGVNGGALAYSDSPFNVNAVAPNALNNIWASPNHLNNLAIIILSTVNGSAASQPFTLDGYTGPFHCAGMVANDDDVNMFVSLTAVTC